MGAKRLSLNLTVFGFVIILQSVISTYESYTSTTCDRVSDPDDDIQPEFLVIGIDISETEAIALIVPIRIGPNNERYIWSDDINPK